MNEERVTELLSSEEYVKGLFDLGNYEAAAAKLAEDGVVISADELENFINVMKKQQNGELSDEVLENVSGGLGPLAAIIVAMIATGVTATVGGVTASKC